MKQPVQQIDLSFVESQMYSAIQQATPEQQAELRALAISQSLAKFTDTLQQRFPQYANYITEERVRNVLAYDQHYQAQIATTPLAQTVAAPTSQLGGAGNQQPVPPAVAPLPVPASPKVAREEMWWIMLAKSKTMRFFAVSCEFIIFLGCLWLTLVTIMPTATGWLNGGIDSFFLIAMGFAVDAALPEAWLHVVDQYISTPRKKSQLKWSVPIAIGMLLLVIANFVYAKLAGTSGQQPTGAIEGLVNALLIARMAIGIGYVTIRECQSFIDRKQAKQHATPPAQDIQHMIDQAVNGLQSQFDQRLAGIFTEQGEMLASIQQLQNAPVPVPEIDTQAVIQAVAEYLIPQFQAKFQALDQAISKQNVTITEVLNQAKRLPENAMSTQAVQPPFRQKNQAVKTPSTPTRQPEQNVIRLVPANASRDELKAEAIRLHTDEGLSSYKIAERFGKSAKTVQSWLSSGKDQAESEEIEQAN